MQSIWLWRFLSFTFINIPLVCLLNSYVWKIHSPFIIHLSANLRHYSQELNNLVTIEWHTQFLFWDLLKQVNTKRAGWCNIFTSKTIGKPVCEVDVLQCSWQWSFLILGKGVWVVVGRGFLMDTREPWRVYVQFRGTNFSCSSQRPGGVQVLKWRWVAASHLLCRGDDML